MTGPEQVLVNVADLRLLATWNDDRNYPAFKAPEMEALYRILAAIPEHEWEPTDDMPGQYKKAHGLADDDSNDAVNDLVIDRLKALHREGLL